MVQDYNLLLPSVMSLYYPSPCPHNKHRNVQLQFLSLCRLQQLAMASRLTVLLVSLLLATAALMFWLWLMILPGRVKIQCPEECSCKLEGLIVNCSDSGLNSIPSVLPTHVLDLVLDGNNITFFENDTFVSRGLVELQTIQADFCKIRKIELGAFNGLTKFRNLSIQGNEITEIIPGTFQKASQLKLLILWNNRIEKLESDVFCGLVELYYIDLEGNRLQYLHPDTFSGLPNLQKLFLSNNPGLQIPTDRHFITSHSLKLLGISGCNVSSVSVETFANVSALKQLDLSYNNLRSFDINILKVLPKLSELYLNANNISEIIPGTLETFSHLEYLHLHYNKIEQLESDVFCGLVKIEYIDLDGNRLQYLHPDTFEGLPKLENLYISNNPGLQIPTDRHFITSLSLKYLVISHCNVSSVSVETFANVSALEWLHLSYNNLRSFDINILKVLPKLSKLYLHGNKITEIIPGTLETFSHLEYLHLQHNKIEQLESVVFCGLVKIEYIDLEGNRLQYLHPDTFECLPKLESLFLSNNSGLQIPTDRHFITSHSLKDLDISYCNVTSVSVETFANVSALEGLDLNHNNLRSLDINMLKALPKLSSIFVDSNPLQCDCQLQEVWRWCDDRNIQTAFKVIVPLCDTPMEVKGMWWAVLEKGQCLEGNVQYYGDYKNTSYSYTPIEDMDTDTATGENKFIDKFAEHYQFPVSAVLFIFGTTGNVIIIIIITCHKDMRTVPNMYILNLAISDILFLTVLFSEFCPSIIPDLLLHVVSICTLRSVCYRMSVGLSAYSVAMLSIQRYRVTGNPIRVHVSSKPTWRATVATICGVWTVAALFALPAALSNNYCYESTFLLFSKYYQHVAIFHLLVSCVIPMCVIAFSYIITARHLLESSTPISQETQNPQISKRKNTAKVVLGLTVVFLISYVPYHISEIYLNIQVDLHLNQFSFEYVWIQNVRDITSILKLFISFNSCLNPVAVFCTSLAFRRQLKRYLTCCCKAKSTPTDFELTRRN